MFAVRIAIGKKDLGAESGDGESHTPAHIQVGFRQFSLTYFITQEADFGFGSRAVPGRPVF